MKKDLHRHCKVTIAVPPQAGYQIEFRLKKKKAA